MKTVKQPNNRVLCVGVRVERNSGEGAGLLISLEADGSPNIQFNSGKAVFTVIDSSSTDWIDANFQPDGSFLTTALLDTTAPHYAVSKFFSNGVHDKVYGNGVGWFAYNMAKNFAYPSSDITDNTILLSISDDRRAIGRGLMS